MPLVLPRRSLNLDFVRDGQASGDNYTTELSKLDGLLTFARASTATRFNAAGVLETVASGQPRFDFDPVTLACKGLLIEEARTNYFFRSDDIGHAAWASLGSPTITSNDAASGSAIATRISGVSGDARQQGQSGLTSGATRTYAVEAKAGTQSVLRLQETFYLGDGKNFDLAAGTCDAGAQILPLGSGWYRCMWTRASAGGETIGSMSFRLTGTGYLWVQRAQLEEGSFATSYIPTTTAAVTRALETCVVSTLTPWFSAAAGTFLFEWIRNNNSGYQTLAHLGGGSYLAYINPGSDGLLAALPVTSAAAFGAAVPVSATPNKMSLSYTSAPTARGAANGSAVTAITATGLDMSSVTIRLGHNAGNGEHINGHIRRLGFMPYAVSDTLLKALST